MTPTPAARLAALRPRLRSVGVTGTNGKTTTTSMVAAIVAASGETAARTTTLGSWVGDTCVAHDVSLGAFVRTVEEATRRGVHTLSVETTSKALAGGFARAWPADVAVFTNLTRDHLDVHGSPEAYLAAKAQLFMAVPPDGTVVWNLADPACALLDELVPATVRRLGWAVAAVHPECAHLPLTLRASSVRVTRTGTHFEAFGQSGWQALSGAYQLACVGAVHVQNALAACLAAAALGYDADVIRRGLGTFAGVAGRFEVVAQRPLVVVDYAHTPDALARTLTGARTLVGDEARLSCVFGCGGNKDQGKRGLMGAVADEHADVVVITHDNPRREDPEAILDAIEAGVLPHQRTARWYRRGDRAEAIHLAIRAAADADAVVIAGRGHETEQLFADKRVPLSDRVVATEALAARTKTGDNSPTRAPETPGTDNRRT